MQKVQKLKMQYGKLHARFERMKSKLPKKFVPLINFAERGARFNRDIWWSEEEEKRLTAVIRELGNLCKIIKDLL